MENTPQQQTIIFSKSTSRRQYYQPIENEDNLDSWLVSFADLVTLMLAFFIVLYAASRIDVHKAEQIKESLIQTLSPAKKSTPPTPSTTQPITNSYEHLIIKIHSALNTLGLNDLARVRLVATGVALTATGDLLFNSGSAELTPRAIMLLSRISQLFTSLPYDIRIEGHTDDIPIHTQQFPSNWELSAARAGSVARFLIEHGIDPDRLAVTGYANTHPLPLSVGTTDVERRAANRRVVFLFEKASHLNAAKW